MKKIFPTVTIIVFLLFAGALNSKAQTSYSATRGITLKFKGDDGTNGCSVTWNPGKKVYYANIAGNEVYPLEMFSESGKNLFAGEAGYDSRGLWYNPSTQKLEGNGYSDNGIKSYQIEGNGKPGDLSSVFDGAGHQPSDQSVGTYDQAKNQIVYFNEGAICRYNRDNGNSAGIKKLKLKKVNMPDINSTTIVYTGRVGEEFGLLDYISKTVYLLNEKGKVKAKVILPSDAVTHDMFRFSFANGKIWLYDVDTRSWTGYTF